MMTRFILAALLALAGSLGASPWNKLPEKWDLRDVFEILQDSPWSPVRGNLETKPTSSRIDSQTDASGNSSTTNRAYGVQFSRGKQHPRILVLWWSAKTVRLAEQRLEQLVNPTTPAQPLRAEDLPDYVLAIQGDESLYILRNAKENLQDVAFLELADGVSLDPMSVRFVDASEQEDQRVEFHFPKQIDGHPTFDSDSDRVIFHCKASAKAPRVGHENAIAVHAEFRLRAMRVHGVPDL
jgi:hypothetical protein